MSRPLYKQLVDSFLAQIDDGSIKVGERLPPESDYAEQLGVSRSTLRLAFSELERSNIIKRRKRGGTEVISDKPVKRYNMITDGMMDILSLGEGTLLLLSDVGFIDGGDVEDLADFVDVSKRWLSIQGSRSMMDEDSPFTMAHIYIPEQFSKLDIQEGDKYKTIFSLIEEKNNVSIGRIKQSVSTEICTKAIADCIGLEEGDPTLTAFVELRDTNNQLLKISKCYFDPARVNVLSDIQVKS